MALRLLTDENFSPAVARQMRIHRPDIPVECIFDWQSGRHVGVTDADLIQALADDVRTLVTYDLSTIPPLLAEMASEGEHHAGVIFVDNRTIASSDYGTLIRALIVLYDRSYAWDWEDRVDFLTRTP
jgi:hypothetical protein